MCSGQPISCHAALQWVCSLANQIHEIVLYGKQKEKRKGNCEDICSSKFLSSLQQPNIGFLLVANINTTIISLLMIFVSYWYCEFGISTQLTNVTNHMGMKYKQAQNATFNYLVIWLSG